LVVGRHPPKRAATVAPVVTPGNPAQTPGGLLLQGKAEGCPQVRGGHESVLGRFPRPTLRWVPGLARLPRLSRLQAIGGSVAP